MEPIRTVEGTIAPLPAVNVDTDQIIPASYLKVVDKEGLGEGLFAHWRFLGGRPGELDPEFVLNRPEHRDATVLLAGDNFGCGSSREHAPWALMGFGFRAVISTSFADIFRNNCLKNALLPIAVDEATLDELFAITAKDESPEVTIDLARQVVRLPSGREATFPIDEFSKKCLLAGVDQLGYLQGHEAVIASYETSHAARVNTV
jgi:3-isopropylmalate/(R)-2-methylmalate dehydratase small subunit